jgi:hypothetical protein
MQRTALLLIVLALDFGCSSSNSGRAVPSTAATTSPQSTPIVVLRHHPGMIDTAPSEQDWGNRDADVELIKLELAKANVFYQYAGGLGRGYELAVWTEQRAEWKRLVDRLIREGELKYYKRWSLDHHGFGLVPLD